MRRGAGWLTIVLVSGTLACSCAHSRPRATPIALALADSGKALDLVVGQTVVVRLEANPSTGYQWQIAANPDERIALVVDSGYDRPASDAAGAAGQAWWKLRATGPGSTTIALRYVRPWEPEQAAKTFEATITVK